jgi:hypothetical protein
MEIEKASLATIVVTDGDGELAIGQVHDLVPDLVLIDALARLQLFACRMGCSIELRDVCDELRDLVALVGLDELLLEPRRQPEGGEQLGTEEVVERGDPSA